MRCFALIGGQGFVEFRLRLHHLVALQLLDAHRRRTGAAAAADGGRVGHVRRGDDPYRGAGAEELPKENHGGVGRAAAAGAEDVATGGDEGEVCFGDVPDAVEDVGGVGQNIDF